MRRLQMYFRDINPHVRYVNLLQCDPGFVEGPRRIYDHQFIYVHKGKGKMEIDRNIYTTLPGDLLFYGPGVIHAFNADASDPYLLSGFHFDFTDHFKDLPFPIGSFSLQMYNEELATESVEFKDFNGFSEKINLCANTKIQEIIREMLHEFENGKIFNQEYLDSLFKTFLVIVARSVLLNNIELDSKDDITNCVIRFIQEHYNEDLTNESIAVRFHFHHNYLNQLMVAHTGISLRQYLIDIRIKKALDMLLHTRLSITDISETVGYKDLHYFSRVFKKKTGLTPAQVRSGPQ